MTCHGLAEYDPSVNYRVNDAANRQKPYGTDYYMSRDDPEFDGKLQFDFEWSILGNLVLGE